jgi:hypothetical protein
MKNLRDIVRGIGVSILPYATIASLAFIPSLAKADEPGDAPENQPKPTVSDDCKGCETEQLFEFYEAKAWNKVVIPEISGTTFDAKGDTLLKYVDIGEISRLEESFMVPKCGTFKLDKDKYVARVARDLKIAGLVDKTVLMRVRGYDGDWHYFQGPTFSPDQPGIGFWNHDLEAYVVCVDKTGRHIVASVKGEVNIFPCDKTVEKAVERIVTKTERDMEYEGRFPGRDTRFPERDTVSVPVPIKAGFHFPRLIPRGDYQLTGFVSGHDCLPDFLEYGVLHGNSVRPPNSVKIVDKESRRTGGNAELRTDHLLLGAGFDRYVAIGTDMTRKKATDEEIVRHSALVEQTLSGTALLYLPIGSVPLVFGGDGSYQTILTQTQGFPDINVEQIGYSGLVGLSYKKGEGPKNSHIAILGGVQGYSWWGEGDSQRDIAPHARLTGFLDFGILELLGAYGRTWYADSGNDFEATAREDAGFGEVRAEIWKGLGLFAGYSYAHEENETTSVQGPSHSGGSVRTGETARNEFRVGLTYGFDTE